MNWRERFWTQELAQRVLELELPKAADVSDLIVEAVRAVDVYRPILEDAVREMEAQGLPMAATYREWLSDPAGFRPYAEMAKAFRSLGERPMHGSHPEGGCAQCGGF